MGKVLASLARFLASLNVNLWYLPHLSVDIPLSHDTDNYNAKLSPPADLLSAGLVLVLQTQTR